MQDCGKYMEQISAMVDCELSAEQKAGLEEHLKSCRECRNLYEALKTISCEAKNTAIEPPESLKADIMKKVRLAAGQKKHRHLPFGRYVATAAVFALIVFAAVRGGIFRPEVTPDGPAALCALPGGGDARGIEGYKISEDYGEDYKNKYAADNYGRALFAVLIIEGEVPESLKDKQILLENDSEIQLELSAGELNSLKDTLSADCQLYSYDENAETGLVVVIKK